MAIYHDLDNTGQEVQQRLDQVPVTQADLAEEVLARQAAVGAVQNNVDAEELRAKAAEKLNADDIDAIEEKIPSGASSSNKMATASDISPLDAAIDAIEEKIPSGASSSNKMATASDISSLDAAIEAILLLIPSAATSLNKLADKAFVNSSIATATATFRGTKNLVSDLNLAVDATHEQIAVALSEAVPGADNNDYAFVQVPTSSGTPTEITETDRYKFDGTAWSYEYDLNNSGFTSDQLAAINSTITSGLVDKLNALPSNADLTAALGILTNGIAAINEKIPTAATSSNKLVDNASMQSAVSGKANISDMNTALAGKQDVISDLAAIRSGAAAGANAQQPATTLAGYGITDAYSKASGQALENSVAVTLAEQDSKIDLLNGSEVVVVADHTAVSDPDSQKIYRQYGTTSYTDWMCQNGAWQDIATYSMPGIDDEPTAGSENLVKSGGVYIDSIYTKAIIDNNDIKELVNNKKHAGYVSDSGTVISYGATWFYSDPILLKAGYVITTELTSVDTSVLSIAQGDSVNIGDTLTPINSKTYKATNDVYIVISGKVEELNKPIYIKSENAIASIVSEHSKLIGQIDKDFYGIGNTVRNKYINEQGIIHDDTDWNIISLEINQNDSVTWVCGALKVRYHCFVLYDINDNILDYWSSLGIPSNMDSRYIDISNYQNVHHIVASFSDFLLNGDENTTPLVINGVGVESIDRTAEGSYNTVKELNKKVSEIYTEPYDEYGVIGINYHSEVKKVIEDIDKNIRGTKLHFCHVSDNHGGALGYANEFTDLSPAKFLIDTGDLVADIFSDSFDTPKGLILAMNKPGFIVLGNHDVYESPSLQARFEKYFAPLNEHNGLTGNTKTYYSVDYSQEKVKCIFLDMNDGWDDTSDLNMSYFIGNSKMSSEQINWFAQELINAKTNNLHVACFIHISPDYVDYKNSPIDFYDSQVEKANNVAFLCDMIDKFIEGGTVTFAHNEQEYTFSFAAGGHFVGWFCGHMHCDTSGWMLNHPKQFSIIVPRPGWNAMEEDGTYRIPKLGITFNYVTIDTTFQRLSILRMGNNKTIWGTPREGFSIRYN